MLKLARAHPAATVTLLVLALLAFGTNLAAFYTDWLWFGEIGQRAVFARIAWTRLGLFVVFGGLAFAFALANLRLAERLAPFSAASGNGRPDPAARDVFVFDRDGRPVRSPGDAGGRNPLAEMLAPSLRKIVRAVLGLGALVLALIAGLAAQGQWDPFLRFVNGTTFGTHDPLFGHDIGFYVFRLPFLQFTQGWLLVVLLAVFAGVAGLYVFQKGIDTATGRPVAAPHVRAHLSGLAALALLTQAWGVWLGRFDLLTAGGKTFTGAGYTDVHVRLPLMNVLVVVTVLGALALLVNVWRRAVRLPLAALGLWLAAVIFGAIIPGTVQATKVKPNEASLEAPYISRAITATRQAFQLDKVRVEEFPAEANLDRADLARNAATLRNVRLWDYEPLLETYPQQQGQRQYYSFPDVDVDRYRLNNDYRQVWLAPREINPDGLDARAQTWPNEHLRYTHGYGLVMSPVNAISSEGLPEFFLKNIPVESTVPGLTAREPRVYFGQAASRGSYVVVKTRQPEFDYPSTATGADRSNVYDGRGGVPLSPLAKLAFAWRFRDSNLLLSGAITNQSRLLFGRRVPDRVQRVAPFLRLDADPYPVLMEGRLVWVQDAYTSTDAYPYAARQESGDGDALNYLRNSVKAIVDAYDGTVTLYAADASDPILAAYRRIFPGLVKDIAAMPAGLRAHLRYPEDLLRVQRRVLADYHVTEPGRFYAREDSWEIAQEQRDVETGGGMGGATQSADVSPYYVIMRLPGQSDEEFLLLSPFTPRNKGILSALLAARCDGDKLGELILYRFPTTRTVYGPEQIGLRVRQDSQISQNLSLWNQQGSRVLFGNLLVVPIERSLLYVQPLYLKAQTGEGSDPAATAAGPRGGSIPELKRVIVAFENRIAMEPTLDQALARLFSETAETVPQQTSSEGAQPSATAPVNPLVEQANAQYARARTALRNGDFAAYGREINALGQTLERLRSGVGTQRPGRK